MEEKFKKPDPELNCPCEPNKPCGLHKIQFFPKNQKTKTPKDYTNEILKEYNSTNKE